VADFQIWLVHWLAHAAPPVAAVMHTAWGWPIMESLHLLGLGKRIPIAAAHRLVPWGLAGFAINITSGSTFLLTEPNQYIYNPSFHFKVLFVTLAGLNALSFYAISWRRATADTASPDAPRYAKVVAAVSLSLWIGVIVAGRLLTFYRPGDCPATGPGFIADCIPRTRR
jgi:uncharacterized membrane protein